eukprot:scaffold11639_cov172-Amphora_coffeaeformis.AAC.27
MSSKLWRRTMLTRQNLTLWKIASYHDMGLGYNKILVSSDALGKPKDWTARLIRLHSRQQP